MNIRVPERGKELKAKGETREWLLPRVDCAENDLARGLCKGERSCYRAGATSGEKGEPEFISTAVDGEEVCGGGCIGWAYQWCK